MNGTDYLLTQQLSLLSMSCSAIWKQTFRYDYTYLFLLLLLLLFLLCCCCCCCLSRSTTTFLCDTVRMRRNRCHLCTCWCIATGHRPIQTIMFKETNHFSLSNAYILSASIALRHSPTVLHYLRWTAWSTVYSVSSTLRANEILLAR